MYTYQALWSAAHHRIAAKFVICHNSGYRLLKENLVRYWHDGGSDEREFPPFFDVHEPTIDFVALAGALGVPGRQVCKPGEVDEAVRAMLDHDGPYLLELVLESDVPGSETA